MSLRAGYLSFLIQGALGRCQTITCACELDKLFVDLDWGDQRACIEETGVGREGEGDELGLSYQREKKSKTNQAYRETDDVRSASSLASRLLLQHLTTTIAALVLAFLRSSLTLVILTLLQSLSQDSPTLSSPPNES